MSNFRTTADLLDDVLRRSGELTSDLGVSPRQGAALLYLNQIHQTIITGGNELNLDVDEAWVWARARRPLILQFVPPVTAGTVSLTQGSVSGTFSTIPQVNAANASLEGWFIRLTSGPELYQIAQHTSGSTSFQLDSAFPQTTGTAFAFTAMKLDYDLIGAYMVIDDYNDTLDFIESGTTVLSGTITHGVYTPAGLATAVAAALNAAGTHSNTYACTYNSLTRLFSVTSNLGGTGTPLFTIKNTTGNYYRSGWSGIGFDYLDFTGTTANVAYVGTYPHSSLVRLTEAGRIFYGSNYSVGADQGGQIALLDNVAFGRDWPLASVDVGTPDYFTVVGEKADGTLKIRINKYPNQNMRAAFEHISWPKDLQNNAASVPLVPKKFIRVLEYGAAAYLCLDKSDSKAQNFFQIAQQTLTSMMKFNRRELERAGRNFGSVIARPDNMPSKKRMRLNNYGYDSGSY